MTTWVDSKPELSYWVEDGKPDPDVPWPKNWEVCGVPERNPLAIRDEDKRKGTTILASPMYDVGDFLAELDHICSFLELMPEGEPAKWLSLQDRQLTFSFSYPEIDASDMNPGGFDIPDPFIQRISRLRIRLMIGFHPAGNVMQWRIY